MTSISTPFHFIAPVYFRIFINRRCGKLRLSPLWLIFILVAMVSRRGHMDAGAPIIMCAILGGIALAKLWDQMSDWMHGIGVVIIGAIALYGLYQSVFGFKGFSANAKREEARQAKEQAAKSTAEGSDDVPSHDDDAPPSQS